MFVAATLLHKHDGSVSAFSRWLVLLNLAESGSFAIDGYQGFTIDWAHTPDGHYYSNKAPGPVLAAYPFFKAVDLVQTRNATGPDGRWDARRTHARSNLALLSFVYQTLFAVVIAFVGFRRLTEWGASAEAAVLFTTTVFFGTTPSLLMNVFFGHAFGALCLLACVLATISRRYAWAGFAFGWALLSDYGAAFVLLGLLPVWLIDRQVPLRQRLGAIALGGLLPAVLWCLYHYRAFGGIFTLPTRFQNPMFVDQPAGQSSVWGVFYPVPQLPVVWKLLFGPERGLAVTQPWLLLVLVAGIAKMIGSSAASWWERHDVRIGVIASLGLAGLIVMNAAFGAWWGGSTIGPRYLSPVLLVFGLWGALIYDRLHPILRALLWAAIAVSIVLYSLVLPQTVLAGEGPLWPFLVKLMRQGGREVIMWVSFTFAAIAIAVATGILAARRQHAEPRTLAP